MNIKVIILGLLILGFQAKSEWILAAHSKTDQVYYQAGSVQKSGDVVKVWTKSVPTDVALEGRRKEKAKAESDKEQSFKIASSYAYSLNLVEVRCEKREFRIVENIDYDDQKTVLSLLNEPTDWTNISPDSLMEGLWKMVCE